MRIADAVKRNLEEVRERIRHACERAGRHASSVTLVGVTKQVPVEVMREAVALGLTDIGENRVQEARNKQAELGYRLQASGSSLQLAACSVQPVRWHLIGHLQRNKAKMAVELFDVIHSVDSLELVQELECHAAKLAQGSRLKAEGSNRQLPLPVFIQVNIAGEMSKFGCRPEETLLLARQITGLPHLRTTGLMTIAPLAEDPEAARPHFRRLRQLRDELAVALSLQPSALSLSMGMSHDFEVAIEEGADVVRIGTAIFGTRDRRQETGQKKSDA